MFSKFSGNQMTLKEVSVDDILWEKCCKFRFPGLFAHVLLTCVLCCCFLAVSLQ